MAYPDMIISSSTPYNFICCRPQPSLIRRGIHFFLTPVRLGVWYMRICTLSEPNSVIKGVNNDAHEADGVSRVPRRASVRKDTWSLGFFDSAACIVEILWCQGGGGDMAKTI